MEARTLATERLAAQVPRTDRVTITGQLDPDIFVPWIARYACKLGLSHTVVAISRGRIELDVVGHPALIEMLTIGCSLGPRGVWVETVDQRNSQA